MKRFVPFIFPAVAVVVLLVLGYRWYSLQTARTGELPALNEGIAIEDLSNSATGSSIIKGSKDYKTVTLQGEGQVAGDVRYELKDGKVIFMVTAQLPELAMGRTYQVWLKTATTEPTRAFVLEMNKGGYTGTGSISSSILPVEVMVSEEANQDGLIEKVLLKGVITQQ